MKQMSMPKVCIIGHGAWGQALYHVVRQNTSHVRIALRGEEVDEEIVILAVPTNNIHELTSVIRTPRDKLIIVNASKGIEEKTGRLPNEIVKNLFPGSHYYTLIGPGFAGEVMQDMPTLVNLGYGHESVGYQDIVTLFQTNMFRVRPVEAVTILELSAAMKNIYAIGCGIADGLLYKTNTRVLLLVLAIEELQYLFRSLNLTPGPQATAGTIGDVVLTCNSLQSRNFQFGRHLASKSVKESLDQVTGVVEGYSSLMSLTALEEKAGVVLPLARFIADAVNEDNPQTIQQRFETFIKEF